MSQNLGEKYFSQVPYSRVGEYTGKIKCPCHYEFWRHVEDLFSDVKDKIIVDMGCGPGLKGLTLSLAGANVIAIDNSHQRLDELKKNLAQIEDLHGKLRFSFYKHDLREEIPFLASESADFILCYEVIEHLGNIEVFVREMVRILKPGGQILITTPNKNVLPVERGERVYGERLHGHVNTFDAAGLKTVFNIEGISSEKLFFYKHSLMRACCSIIHRVMKFDKYKRSLPIAICNLFNRGLFPILNLLVQLEERLKEKRDRGIHIFLLLKKGCQS